MSDQGVRLTLRTAELNRAARRFLRRAGPEVVDKAIRKIAADVVAETVRGITTVSPTRVDTGRYRAGWGYGARAVGLRVAVPRSAEGGPSDGSGAFSGAGLERRVTVANNVEYARFVELGARYMQPGNHLSRALVVVRRRIPGDRSRGSIADAIGRLWRS